MVTTFFDPATAVTPDHDLLVELGRWLGSFASRSRREDARRNSRVLEVYRRLSATLAGELNNALCVVLTGLGHLREEVPDDESLAEALASANRAAEVSRQLLEDATGWPLGDDLVDLRELILDVASDLRGLVGPGVRLEVILDENALVVRGESAWLERTLSQLVANAAEAVDGRGHIVIRCHRHDGCSPSESDEVHLSVSDDGTGMDEESRAQALDPLFSTRGRTGIGLTQVHSVVTHLGGEVELGSRPGEGSTLTVRLPAACERAAVIASPPPGAARDEGSLAGTVLLVEDSPALRRQLRRLLVATGLKVLDTGSAEEALRLSREAGAGVSLLLTDVGLPGRSGAELAREMRGQAPRLPVLLISGYPKEVLAGRLQGCPFDGFLQKPFEAEVLLHELRKILLPKAGTKPNSSN